ncbi:hypothetical protein EHF38_12595 [Acinetobacter baumannii]|uniref:hypothetical protein n=1 Tax=Acinetobacter baumannii TaxID=470 RepID=UPI000FEC703E|nr:hypothetical protein [Acinetobacter baumannii]QAB41127.1 hypothetical protein EHF38_12595 [Acinetobacter baumannii]
MKFELKNFLINICGWIIIITMCFFLVVFVIFIEDKVQQPFKETLTLTLSFLSALATIGAAIIAAMLFQTWKNQHSYIEQSKLLVEMMETVSNLVFALSDVRQNDNLESIFLGQIPPMPMEEAFDEQIKRAALLDHLVAKLNTLENQIYLLNNIKCVSRVFCKDAFGETILDKLITLITTIQTDISSIYEMFTINYGDGFFVISNLNLSDPSVHKMILNSSFEGDKLLRKAVPDLFILDHNPANIEITECFIELNKSIMKYKDSLDTLN